MKFFSTRNSATLVSAREAVLNGLAVDGGLYLPEQIPHIHRDFLSSLKKYSRQEIALEVLREFFAEDLSPAKLDEIVCQAFNFEAPTVLLDDDISVLELFHGPTLAFKDFGARFMARVTSEFLKESDKKIVVLVATSGDTGGAVANGFFGIDGIKVVVLYPSGKVSPFQESQFANLGGNITALEVEGTFDDCQKMVKSGFADQSLRQEIYLASANSINVARLLPQMLYYFLSAQSLDSKLPLTFSVPSGNFGNLTAGVLAHRMGLSVGKIIAATNANDIIPKFLATGDFEPRPSIQTISNAMDVGNPSNFERILHLFGRDLDAIREEIQGYAFSDQQTRDGMREIFAKFNYLADPHTAVAYLGLKRYQELAPLRSPGIILSTAHPIKFSDVVQDTLGITPNLPPWYSSLATTQKFALRMPANYLNLREIIKAL